MLQIYDVINDGKLIAVEISDGKETWFYAFDQTLFPSLRVGKFPCDKTGKEYQRQFRIKYEDEKTILMFIDPNINLNPIKEIKKCKM